MSYDRASVDRYFAEVEEQRRRLQSQVDAAREELRKAEAATAERAEAQAELAAGFLLVQREIEKGERAHREQLAEMSAAAAAAAAGVRAGALAHVDAMRAAATVAATVNLGGR